MKFFIPLGVAIHGLSFSALFLADETPTTIMGAFICVSLGMASLVFWIVKRQFENIDKQQQMLTNVIEAVQKNQNSTDANQKRLEEMYTVLLHLYDDVESRGDTPHKASPFLAKVPSSQ